MWKNLITMFRKDNLYLQALDEAHTMLDIDWKMFQASVKSLRESDTGEIDVDIYAEDKQINAYERDVRKKVMTHLAIAGGGADLASGLVLVSVAIDIERIGDYTKNIYDLARKHPRKLHGGSLEPQLKEAEALTTHIFKEMIEAFKTSDEEKARVIMAEYKQELAALCDSITDAIVTGNTTDLSPHDATAVALYARFLKRIAAHSRNIISSVVNPFPRIGYKEKANAE